MLLFFSFLLATLTKNRGKQILFLLFLLFLLFFMPQSGIGTFLFPSFGGVRRGLSSIFLAACGKGDYCIIPAHYTLTRNKGNRAISLSFL